MILETLIHRGVPICLCDEAGRRFWSASVPDPSGWHLPQEFCSCEQAVAYVDGKLAHNQAYAERIASGRDAETRTARTS